MGAKRQAKAHRDDPAGPQTRRRGAQAGPARGRRLQAAGEDALGPSRYLARSAVLVWMGNDDLSLIRGPGEGRRRYLDFLGTQAFPAYRPALLAYDKALRLDPENAYVLNNYSYYLSLRKQNLEKAKQMSAYANKLEPNNDSFLDTYAWIMFQLGDYNAAKEAQEKAHRKFWHFCQTGRPNRRAHRH